MLNHMFASISAVAAALVIAGSVTAQSAALSADGIVRDVNGHPSVMTQVQATKACPEGYRLPTIRELAKDAENDGAVGIAEINERNAKSAPPGFKKVSAMNSDGKADAFYFNLDGYKAPVGSMGINWFWSSSVVSERPSAAYAISGFVGNIDSCESDVCDQVAVRCVPNR